MYKTFKIFNPVTLDIFEDTVIPTDRLAYECLNTGQAVKPIFDKDGNLASGYAFKIL